MVRYSVVVFMLTLLAIPTPLMAQCELGKQLLVPVADRAKYSGYGSTVASFGDHLVVGESGNDSLQFAAGLIHVYKLNASNQWTRVALLSASDPQKFANAGELLAINETTIVTVGDRHDVTGKNHPRIHCYERDISGEWQTGTESYSIILNDDEIILNLTLSETYLAVTLYKRYQGIWIYLYKKQSGVFSFLQAIAGPLDARGRDDRFANQIAMNDDVLVASSWQFENAAGEIGAALVYERSGEFWSSDPVATLEPSDRSATRTVQFGGDVLLDGTSILVSGIQGEGTYTNAIYVYERPTTGWTGSITETWQIGTDTGYPVAQWHMAGAGEYLFLPNEELKKIAVYKRTGGSWQHQSLVQIIDLPSSGSRNWLASIAVTGDHLVIGQAAFEDDGTLIGGMFDYIPDGTWENGAVMNQQKKETSVNASDDVFGDDIAVEGDVMAVGATGDEDKGGNGGAVYMYRRVMGQWVQTAKIIAPVGYSANYFGTAVALSGDNLFVGAPETPLYASGGAILLRNVGTVYVYKRSGNNWIYDSQFYSPQQKGGQLFGREITYCNGYVAVAEYIDRGTGYQGLVHLYKQNAGGAWTYLATLRPSDLPASDSFGRSIAMDDSTIVVGTGMYQTHIAIFRKIYVYRKKGGEWSSAFEDAQLFPSVQTYSDRFGYSVALYGNQIVAGAPGYSPPNNPGNASSGVAYVFTKPAQGWKGTLHETAQLLPGDPSRNQVFGFSVAMDEDDIYIGAPHSYFVWSVTDNHDNTDGHIKPGALYHYFKEDAWDATEQENEKILSPDPEFADAFGAKVILQNNALFIGAPLDDTDSGYKTGSVLTSRQAPLITGVRTPCVEDGDVVIWATPAGGTWRVTGRPDQSSHTFHLPAGSYTATYHFAGCDASPVTFGVISSGLSVQGTNAGELEKCVYDHETLVLESNAPAENYTWFYKPTETDAYAKIDDSKQHLDVAEPGFYYAEIGTTPCLPQREYFHVINEEAVVVEAETPPVICSEEPFQLEATPDGGSWSSPATAEGEVDPSILDNGAYPVVYSVVTPLGCTFSAEAILTIDKPGRPEVDASGTKICRGEGVTLRLVDPVVGATLEWHTVEDPDRIISSEDEIEAEMPGTYYVTTSKDGCKVSSEAVGIETRADSVLVPNVITPNGDSKNDFFEIESESLNEFDLFVLNRYGEKIYSTPDPDFKWYADQVPSGVYFWHLHYRNCSAEKIEMKGWVHILH